MPFDVEHWRSQVRDWWTEHGPRIKSSSIQSAYTIIAASAWLPFLTAYADDPGAAMTALVGITSGIGSNLVGNLVQRTYDKVRGGEQVSDQAREDAQTRSELDAILEATHALEAAQGALGDRWEEFARQLVQETAALPGHSNLVTLGEGVEVRGSVVAGDVELRDGSIFVGGNYIQAENVHIADALARQEAEAQGRTLRRRYLTRLSQEVNRLTWTTVERDYADPERGEGLGLSEVYTALDTTELEQVEREEDLRRFMSRLERGEARRIPAQEMVNRQARLLILGNPGSGKSTFVNHLAYTLAQANLAPDPDLWLDRIAPWEHGLMLPVRIELRELAAQARDARADASLLLDHVRRTLQVWYLEDFWPTMERALWDEGEGLLLLLDGLDEVPAAQRPVIVDAVQDFVGSYRQHRCVVTCRPYAYVGQPHQLKRFSEVTLAPFDEEQIDHFISTWYGELARKQRLSSQEAEERAGRLRGAVRRRDMQGLARRPLLLTVMTLLHTFRSQLPDDRTELYADAVDLLLRRWEGRVGGDAGILEQLAIPGLKMSDLEAGLYEVAFRAHSGVEESDATADVREADLRNWLAPYLGEDWNKAGEFVTYIRERAGLLVRHKTKAYTFPHRTFQEFMAACHLVGMDDYPGEAARLVRGEADRWLEVFVLAAGHAARKHRLGQAIGAVNALCPQDVEKVNQPDGAAFRCAQLAGEALLEIGLVGVRREEAGKVALDRVKGWLVVGMQADDVLEPVERAGAGRVLAHLGDPRDLDELVFVPDGPFLMGSREDDEGAYDDEYPQHTVAVGDFWIGKYPVTNGQYARFVEAGGYDEVRYWTEAGWAWRTGSREPDLSFVEDEDLKTRYTEWLAQRPPEKRYRPFWWDDPTWNLVNHPVVGVSWYEALAYTRWLAERTGQPYRLPTEAEWEKAASWDPGREGPGDEERGRQGDEERGRQGDGGRKRRYPWGDEFDENKCNVEETGIGRTSAVGCFPAGVSPCGALDMAGNVWEWCSSVGYSEARYPYRSDDGREELEREIWRALRGASWYNERRWARCAYRSGSHPGDFYSDIGFRVVLPGSPPRY